jgi:hypothetical protein
MRLNSISTSDNKIISFSGSHMSFEDGGITNIPLNTSFNDSFNVMLNPASGMPMVGGISGWIYTETVGEQTSTNLQIRMTLTGDTESKGAMAPLIL